MGKINMVNEVNDKKACAIVQDLLPLYHDNVCSEESKVLVKEHIAECVMCRKIVDELNNENMEKQLSDEVGDVLKRHAQKETRKSAMVGGIVAGILMIPLIVCLICNLAIGHGLSWFFIVLASLLVTASLTITPLVVVGKERKFLWTLGLFTVTLMLLLMVLVLYVHGNWFFITAVPIMLGLSVIFAPIVAAIAFKKGILSKCKGIIVMLWDTLWVYAVIGVCGLYAPTSEYWRIALQITSFVVLMAWIIFLIARYVKFPKVHMPKMVKIGILTLVSGVFIITISDIVDWIIFGIYRSTYTTFDFTSWTEDTINGNINFIILLTAITVGLILVTAGLTCKKKVR
ncbi:MAG TPA: zf-HC2 domain-containing protein [Lachnospiraceae bacterium]|nr:zf-HC2 domain-containing protein [Lachnospiraceae bacterium]